MAHRHQLFQKNDRHYFARLMLFISLLFVFVALLSLSQAIQAQTCKLPEDAASDYDFDMATDAFGPNPDAPTDYYKMAVNWSGDFCSGISAQIESESNSPKSDHKKIAKLKKDNHFQCFSDQRFGWVLHGVWASSCAGKSLDQCTDLKEINQHPRFCGGDLPALPYEQIKPYLCMSPSAALLQAEWEKHGACDFSSATDYFEKSRQLFSSLRYPESYLSEKKLDRWMKKYNPQLADKHLLYRGSEMYICYDTSFNVINCPKRD